MADGLRRVTMEPISGSRRGVSAILGMAGLSAGTIAVFESANQAGTVALLTIGALSSIFALLGKIPLRWVVAGAELDMTYEDNQQTADALSDVMTVEQLRLVAQRLLEAPAQQSPSADNRLRLAATLSRASTVEAEGHTRMKRFVALTPGFSYEQAAADSGIDGVMTAPDGVRIAVDFKAWGDEVSRQMQHQRVQRLSNDLDERLERAECGAMLVLTDASNPTTEGSEFPSVLRRPLRIATFGDSYTFVLQKFNELRDAASRS